MMKKVMAIMVSSVTIMGTMFLVGVKNADKVTTTLSNIPVIGNKQDVTDVEENEFFETLKIMEDGTIVMFGNDNTYEKFKDVRHVALYLNANTDECWTWEDDDTVIGLNKAGDVIIYEINDGEFVKIDFER